MKQGKFEASCLAAAQHWILTNEKPTVVAPTPEARERAEKRIAQLREDMVKRLDK